LLLPFFCCLRQRRNGLATPQTCLLESGIEGLRVDGKRPAGGFVHLLKGREDVVRLCQAWDHLCCSLGDGPTSLSRFDGAPRMVGEDHRDSREPAPALSAEGVGVKESRCYIHYHQV
jgi:hypothetical protein